MRMRLRIERVVLDGVAIERHEREAFEAALRQTLAAGLLAADATLPVHDIRERRVVGPPVRIASERTATTLGAGVGRSVHGALGGVGRR